MAANSGGPQRGIDVPIARQDIERRVFDKLSRRNSRLGHVPCTGRVAKERRMPLPGQILPADRTEPAGPQPLDAIFRPQSIAVVGTTTTPGTVPYDIFYNILSSGYRGTVYPVAPGKRSVCAVRAYRYVLDIEDEVDLAVIVFPAEVVERALEQCDKKGIRGVIVISAGFREIGCLGVER